MISDVLGLTLLGSAGGFTVKCWRGILPERSAAFSGLLAACGGAVLGLGPVGVVLVSGGALGASWGVYGAGQRAHKARDRADR